MAVPTGTVFRREGKRGPVWYARYRLPSRRQVQKKIGPAWTDRGRPAAGYFTKRTAEAWLRSVLDEARRGTLPGMVRTGARLSDAAAEWLRYCEHERACKKSTLTEYRHAAALIVRGLGDPPLEDVTPELIERWKTSLTASNRTVAKYLVNLHGIFRRAMKVWGLPRNPAAEVTGLRLGELLALEWRDVDFASEAIRVRRSYNAHGGLGTPKSGRVRSVPMVPEVGRALAELSGRQNFTSEKDLVFPGEFGTYQDASALRDRYKAALKRAGLRPLRFHDLRHTFGTLAVRRAEIPAVQSWMGHADIQTVALTPDQLRDVSPFYTLGVRGQRQTRAFAGDSRVPDNTPVDTRVTTLVRRNVRNRPRRGSASTVSACDQQLIAQDVRWERRYPRAR